MTTAAATSDIAQDILRSIVGRFEAGADTFSPLVPTTDPDLVLDLDLRLPQAAWAERTASVSGTYVPDPVLGFVPNGLKALQRTSFPHSAAMAAAGAIVMEVQRSGLAYDDSTFDPGDFADLDGNTDTATATASLLWSGNNFSTERWLYLNQNATTRTLVWHDDLKTAAAPVMAQITRIADNVPSFLDQEWATVILTWDGTTEYLIIDGLVISAETVTSGAARMGTVTIGGRGDAAPSAFWRNGAIRRVQFLKRTLAPITSALRVGLIGDSFVAGATNRNTAGEPKTQTQADIEGVQTDGAVNAARAARINAEQGNGYWGWWLQSLAYLYNRQRLWFKIFNAGDPGNGYRTDLNPFGGGPGDALAAWESGTGPDVIIALGSVNDVSGFTAGAVSDPMDSNNVFQIKIYLEGVALKCKSLQKLIWFDPFYTPEAVATTKAAGYYAEIANQRALLATLAPALVNGSGQPVEFARVDTWPLWAPVGTQPPEYAIGSHPDNDRAVTTPDGNDTKRTDVLDGDVHPTSAGYKRIAEIVWPELRKLSLHSTLLVPLTVSTDKVVAIGRQPRDLHVRPSTTQVDASQATFFNTRIALCAADRANKLTVTGGFFTGLSTPNTQQGAWCIGPIRDQNLHAYGDIELVGSYFEGNVAQAFHAFGGGTPGYEAMTWGALTFTNCTAKNHGGEMFYVKGPQTGDITATGCVLGSYDTRTGWASDHTAFAGDGFDFSHTGIGPWNALILINGCGAYNLDGYALVASSNNVVILNSTFEHCWDPTPGATNLHCVLHDPYGPTSSFSMNACTVRSAKEDGGVFFGGASGITGTAAITNSTLDVLGDAVSTAGRLTISAEFGNTITQYTGANPKLAA
jgi:hypothetical protein